MALSGTYLSEAVSYTARLAKDDLSALENALSAGDADSMRIQLIAKPEASVTGIARYTEELRNGLRAYGVDAEIRYPLQPPLPELLQQTLRRTGLDARRFFANYPLYAGGPRADVYHLVGQMLATLLLFQRFPGPVAVSVLDIIPFLVRHDREMSTFRHPVDQMFYRLALRGLARADELIAISHYTRETLITALRLPADRISVVYPAINQTAFRPLAVPDSFLARYGLERDLRYVLFVGSEDRRKNVPSLVKAFALVHEQAPQARLVKVGAPQFQGERRRVMRLIEDLEISDAVQMVDGVDEEDLPLFYNVASVVVLPSFYEGFGLPVAEAMACGTPVVGARAASLPEVAGEAGLQVDPDDICGLADAILLVLGDDREQKRRSEAGRDQAARFSWERVARETRTIYERLYSSARHSGGA